MSAPIALAALGCSAEITVYELPGVGGYAGAVTTSAGMGGHAVIGAGGAPSTGGQSGSGGISSGGDSGASGGGATLDGGAGASDAGGAAGELGAAGESGAACVTASDCPAPPNHCVLAVCDQGTCGTSNVPKNRLFLADDPPDCHATTACDGFGNATSVVDQNDVPTPANRCLQGTCNNAGTPSTEPTAAGTPCTATGGILCDGAGTCVACLHSRDCTGGRSCAATHECVSASCTDLDCGGVCPLCPVGKKCLGDQDCASNACDAVTLTCIADQCVDRRQDGDESSADCGGDTCHGCALGAGCYNDLDCVSRACDGISLVCVGNACANRRLDGDESDVDCGGSVCPRCPTGKQCGAAADCASHSCDLVTHECR